MHKLSCVSLLLGAGLVLAGCHHAASAVAPAPDPLTADMDTAVSPAVDFFTYANGGWLNKNPIPKSESSWGIGNEVENEINARLRTISEQAATEVKSGQASAGTDEQKIGDFWTTGMNTALADQLGLKPLQPELDQIAAAKTRAQIIEVAATLRPLGVAAFFDMGVGQDDKDSSRMVVDLGQGGLGLPTRDFYFNRESGVATDRTEYVAHLGRVLALLGEPPAQAAAHAAAVMKFETALAQSSRTLEALRDPYKNYNPMTPEALETKYAPAISFRQELDGWRLPATTVIVGQPEFFHGLNAALDATPVPVLQEYLRLHVLAAYAPYLSGPFRQEHFRFYNTALRGQLEPQPQWKQVLAAQNRAMGMVLGRRFVQVFFPPATKQRYVKLVGAIRTSFRNRIEQLDWMSPATKAQAVAKLDAVTPKVGYPDRWKDYSALVVGTNSYAENMMNAARWRFHDNVSKFGEPVDRTEWDMTPQTYNAYYNPSNSEIVLPAAQFMVPGVPDDQLDDAIVYGYSGGSTIGHEITHGFDDEGRHYDAHGNLKDWWTKQDSDRFNQRAALMVKEFDAYQPIPGLHIRGQACLGENIADYGGILIGLDAFEQTDEYKAGKKIGGLTPLQRYFLGYALGWLSHQTQSSLRSELLDDVHAPAKYRVLGPLSNIPAFYQAFDVQPGQPMWRPPQGRVDIW